MSNNIFSIHQSLSCSLKLKIAIVICALFISIEITGGLLSHSLALISDATHLLSGIPLQINY